MGLFSFKTPDVGEGIIEVELISWSIAVGDRVVEDQPIADVMTDKANVELTSPVTGKVVRLACAAEEMVAVGAELVCFKIEGEGNVGSETVAASEPAVPAAGMTSAERVPVPESGPEQAKQRHGVENQSVTRAVALAPVSKALASPAVRRHAHELGIDISQVTGSAPKGRVSHNDLERHAVTPEVTDTRPNRGSEQIRMTGLRRVIASTPVLNKPEVAIIGVNRAGERVVVREGEMVIRTMMNLSSSFDHRIVDGYLAAEFIQAIKTKLEHPVTLFMVD